jgi:hypothetical protein
MQGGGCLWLVQIAAVTRRGLTQSARVGFDSPALNVN